MEIFQRDNLRLQEVEDLKESLSNEPTVAPGEFLELLEKESDRVEEFERFLGAEESAKIRGIVGALYEPTKRMVGPILDNIKNGDYQLLVGDDASGRIPALIVRKLINAIYRKAGFQDIPTRFIAGTTGLDGELPRRKTKDNDTENRFLSEEEVSILSGEKYAKVQAYIDDIKNTSNIDISKALVVTEYIQSGMGVVPVVRALQGSKIAPTVLSVYLDSPQENLSGRKEKLGGSLYYGYGTVEEPTIYNKKEISGVSKYFSDLHATSIRSTLSGGEREVISAKMAIARDEANRVAGRLFDELLKPTETEIKQLQNKA